MSCRYNLLPRPRCVCSCGNPTYCAHSRQDSPRYPGITRCLTRSFRYRQCCRPFCRRGYIQKLTVLELTAVLSHRNVNWNFRKLSFMLIAVDFCMCNVIICRLFQKNAIFTHICWQQYTLPPNSFDMLLYYLLFFSIKGLFVQLKEGD